MGGAQSMSWKPICLSIITISQINFKTKNVKCLLILDDSDATYVLMAGEDAHQWFLVKPGTLKPFEADMCNVYSKKVSLNTAFIGELSKLIHVPTEVTQNEYLASC
jgi:hypothetical protein